MGMTGFCPQAGGIQLYKDAAEKEKGDAVSEVFFDVKRDIVHVESTRHYRNVGDLPLPGYRAAKASA
ncbi:hypothetical protein EMIT0P100_20418 [Pseudomonas sp. IT-P100]